MLKKIDYSMNLYFLPATIKSAIDNLNSNFITEIRLRCRQAVIIEYLGEYKYLNGTGVSSEKNSAIICENVEKVLYSAMEGSVFAYAEQLKSGFITVDGAIRIGVAGEYVYDGENVVSVKNVTSLNIRIPHNAVGCCNEIYQKIAVPYVKNTLIFSPPGFGKTTILRDLARKLSYEQNKNVLVFDERYEIAGANLNGLAYDLGPRCDVVRGKQKLSAIANSIRAMKPQIIITDELYGDNDIKAVKYAQECNISVIASSHSTDKNALKQMPFELFIELTGVGKRAVVYDKNFNIVGDSAAFGRVGCGNL